MGSSINWMESGVGTGVGTFRFCNLPLVTSSLAYDIYRDISDLIPHILVLGMEQ